MNPRIQNLWLSALLALAIVITLTATSEARWRPGNLMRRVLGGSSCGSAAARGHVGDAAPVKKYCEGSYCPINLPAVVIEPADEAPVLPPRR